MSGIWTGVGAAVAVIWAGACAAAFFSPMVCTGRMDFPNADGSTETYDLRLTLDAAGYRIMSTHVADGAVTDDAGTCTDYLDPGCRHEIRDAAGEVTDFYDFVLVALDGGEYAYAERWADGFEGGARMTCAPE
ncbi:hypothetical protein [Sagittula stellata]|uniref:Lipoprotein n=1 Tax=Sagittula stellata (strain ATCC 700073 / DSM 11524 / E-37) TaxID=388399 RepID=A3JYN3_SAGS3|nr:hypothetical protein [Sagittula stellata]EBA09586.1 hypothetical protein SSE37_07258 [Sagittula stellata E-37]